MNCQDLITRLVERKLQASGSKNPLCVCMANPNGAVCFFAVGERSANRATSK